MKAFQAGTMRKGDLIQTRLSCQHSIAEVTECGGASFRFIATCVMRGCNGTAQTSHRTDEYFPYYGTLVGKDVKNHLGGGRR